MFGFYNLLFELFQCLLPHLLVVGVVSVYLEQSGMQQQSVGGLGVVVTLIVEVTQLVQVPGRKQQ